MWDIGLIQLTSSHFILNHGAGFYKPSIPQYPPSHLQDYSTCQVIFLSYFKFPCFDPSEWCMKNGLLSGDSNPRPLGHGSSALTTRPWRLALDTISFFFFLSILKSNKFLSDEICVGFKLHNIRQEQLKKNQKN